jgi:hypothetical protein
MTYLMGAEMKLSNGIRHTKAHIEMGFENPESIPTIQLDVRRLIHGKVNAPEDVLVGFYSKGERPVILKLGTNIQELTQEEIAKAFKVPDIENQRQLVLVFPLDQLERRLHEKRYYPVPGNQFGLAVFKRNQLHELTDGVYSFNDPTKRPEALLGAIG